VRTGLHRPRHDDVRTKLLEKLEEPVTPLIEVSLRVVLGRGRGPIHRFHTGGHGTLIQPFANER
jgi:hypothetical protein